MLPKEFRLPLRTELFRIKKKGQIFQGEFFSLLSLNHNDNKPSRFAFIISTKIHKKATKRNRIRRLLSEAVFHFLSEINSGYEVVFLAKKAVADKDLKKIQKEVKKMFQQLGLLN